MHIYTYTYMCTGVCIHICVYMCAHMCVCIHIWGGTPKNQKCIYKKLCIYSYMFKLQSSSKYSPFDARHLLRLFSAAQNSFWTHQFWCLLVLLLFFVSPLPHWQHASLWGLIIIQGNKKKVAHGLTGWIGRVGHWAYADF